MRNIRSICLATLLVAAGTGMAAIPADPAPTLRLRPPVTGCPICELWIQYEDVVLQAKQEVGPLENGVVYFYHSNQPSVIEPLIRFAHERVDLAEAIRTRPEVREQLGGPCGHRPAFSVGIRIEISTSARGIFALLTSTNSTTYTMLRFQAGRAVRSKMPVWF